jgi:hypothetical protein
MFASHPRLGDTRPREASNSCGFCTARFFAAKIFFDDFPRRNLKPIPQFARALAPQSTRFPNHLPAPL